MAVRLTRANNEYMTRASAPDYNSAYSVLFALRPTTVGIAQDIFVIEESTNNFDAISVTNSATNELAFIQRKAGSDATINSGFTLSAGTWAYIAVVRHSATSVEIFAGAHPEAMVSVAGPTTLADVTGRTAADQIDVGTAFPPGGSNPVDGRFRYVRVFSSALTLAQIKAASGTGLWAEWLLPDASHFADSSGNGRDLTPTSSPAPTTEADDTFTWPESASSTVTKTWAFATDAEGLVDQAVSGVAFAWQSADSQSGSGGCVKFTQATKSVTQTERARRSSTGETWETWGVPAGSIVTNVQITAWSERLAANTKLSSHSISARIVGSGGSSVHSAGDLLAAVALGTTTDATWQAGAAGSSRAVDSGSQASNTDVRLELEYSVTTSGGGGSASVDQRFDTIQLTITYQAAVSITGSGAPARRLSASASGTAVQKFTGSGAPSKTLSKSASGTAVQKFNASGSPSKTLSASASGIATNTPDNSTGSGAPARRLSASASGAATQKFTGSGSPTKSLSDSASGTAVQTFTGSGAPTASLSASASGSGTNTPDAGGGATGSGAPSTSLSASASGNATQTFTGSGAPARRLDASAAGSGTESITITGSGAPALRLSASASGTATNDSPVVETPRRGRGYRVLYDKKEPELGPHPEVVPQVADVIEVVDTPEIIAELPTFFPTQADARVAQGITPPVVQKARVAPVEQQPEFDEDEEDLLHILLYL